MLNLTDLKPGAAFAYQGKPYVVLYSQHSKLGRGGAIMRTKIRHLINGSIIEKTFKGSDAFAEVQLERKKLQYLYKEGENFYFMDPETFEQLSIEGDKIGTSKDYLKEETLVNAVFYHGKPMDIELPIKLDLKITYTEPGFKGNTASTTSKPATLESGAQIQVPLFIKIGDIIKVDTRSGEYVGRK